ncbi:MAG: fructose-1,6-bisphosphatase [Lachnospiraceae bacterium]|nr:fructose-1,6-bisphosphatase [Lachnospiraceae bacterium]
MGEYDVKFLKCLAKQYPTIAQTAREIINLQSLLTLPKGTEHFITDIHGEYEQYQHITKNASGAIKRKIEDEFGNTISQREQRTLATLIYYPKRKLAQIVQTERYIEDWYAVTLYRLVRICKRTAVKYSRSKVRKAIPDDYAYIVEELLSGRQDVSEQEDYYFEIIRSIIRTGMAAEFVVTLCDLIRDLVVEHLHVVGDIFDRGPYPHLVMDDLMRHQSIDIQWGNHDVSWMGAAAGNPALICTVIRISAKYGNLNTLEESYGINLIPLARFALEQYETDPCDRFHLSYREDAYDIRDKSIDERIHKAVTIMQLKLEGQIIMRNPDFKMDDRLLLDKIDIEKGVVTIAGVEHPLLDTAFPTIDWNNPYELTNEEKEVMDRLIYAFKNSEKLQKHVKFLYTKGNMYTVHNGNLMFHGCVPLNKDGSFKKVSVFGKEYAGKELYDVLEAYARKGYYATDKDEKLKGMDILWFLWLNKNSPVFGKDRMTTFERYFVEDKTTHKEPKNPYYQLIEDETVVNRILEEFGLFGKEAHIINGHIPVQVKDGQSPMRCNGKVLIIDGGFSKAYQAKTGIAGYTLIYNSYGLVLAEHEPFESIEKAIMEGNDIVSHKIVVQRVLQRKTVADTDLGKALQEEIEDLEQLLQAYREGVIEEEF